jgi:predicted dehydrogenase
LNSPRRICASWARRARGGAAENRHFICAFLGLEPPRLTFDDGLDVVELLMAAYQSAEQERTLTFPPEGLEAFVPAVARGEWRG